MVMAMSDTFAIDEIEPFAGERRYDRRPTTATVDAGLDVAALTSAALQLRGAAAEALREAEALRRAADIADAMVTMKLSLHAVIARIDGGLDGPGAGALLREVLDVEPGSFRWPLLRPERQEF